LEGTKTDKYEEFERDEEPSRVSSFNRRRDDDAHDDEKRVRMIICCCCCGAEEKPTIRDRRFSLR
jgi:hypothetical protein